MPGINKILSFAKILGLQVDNNHIDALMEEHSPKLTTEEFLELHCVSLQKVRKSLSEEKEEVTVKQQSSDTIREMLKASETVRTLRRITLIRQWLCALQDIEG